MLRSPTSSPSHHKRTQISNPVSHHRSIKSHNISPVRHYSDNRSRYTRQNKNKLYTDSNQSSMPNDKRNFPRDDRRSNRDSRQRSDTGPVTYTDSTVFTTQLQHPIAKSYSQLRPDWCHSVSDAPPLAIMNPGVDWPCFGPSEDLPTLHQYTSIPFNSSSPLKSKFQRGVKQKVALILSYRGTGYNGLQFQYENGVPREGLKTIETEFWNALVAANLIEPCNSHSPAKVAWQRAARTDKGVHAASNVVSVKLRIPYHFISPITMAVHKKASRLASQRYSLVYDAMIDQLVAHKIISRDDIDTLSFIKDHVAVNPYGHLTLSQPLADMLTSRVNDLWSHDHSFVSLLPQPLSHDNIYNNIYVAPPSSPQHDDQSHNDDTVDINNYRSTAVTQPLVSPYYAGGRITLSSDPQSSQQQLLHPPTAQQLYISHIIYKADTSIPQILLDSQELRHLRFNCIDGAALGATLVGGEWMADIEKDDVDQADNGDIDQQQQNEQHNEQQQHDSSNGQKSTTSRRDRVGQRSFRDDPNRREQDKQLTQQFLQRRLFTETDIAEMASTDYLSDSIRALLHPHLSPQLHILRAASVTSSFDSKCNASSRTYEYIVPSYVFMPISEYPAGLHDEMKKNVSPEVLAAALSSSPQDKDDDDNDNDGEVLSDDDDTSHKPPPNKKLKHNNNNNNNHTDDDDSIPIYSPNNKNNDNNDSLDIQATLLERRRLEQATSAISSIPDALLSYRLSPQRLDTINTTLSNFIGTKNHWNLTSRIKYQSPQANRYIRAFYAAGVFNVSNITPVSGEESTTGIKTASSSPSEVEFVHLVVHGDSFMLHQIRKMVGITIAACRGNLTDLEAQISAEDDDINIKQSNHIHTQQSNINTDSADIPVAPAHLRFPKTAIQAVPATSPIFTRLFTKQKLHVPTAPALGLLLDHVHYDGYDSKIARSSLTGIANKQANHVRETLFSQYAQIKPLIRQVKKGEIYPEIGIQELQSHSAWRWLHLLNLEPIVPAVGAVRGAVRSWATYRSPQLADVSNSNLGMQYQALTDTTTAIMPEFEQHKQ